MTNRTQSLTKWVLTLAFVLTLSATGWYFLAYRLPLASQAEILEFGATILTSGDSALLDSLQTRRDAQLVEFVVDNQYEIRSAVDKILQKGLYQRFVGKPDSAETLIDLAATVASIYEDELKDSFPKREVVFLRELAGETLDAKLSADWYYFKAGKIRNQEPDLALKYYERSLELSRQIDDRKVQADNLIKMQHIWFSRGDAYDRALELSQEALKISQEIGYRFREQWARHAIGCVYLHLARYHDALENLVAGLKVAESLGDDYCQMVIHLEQGHAHSRLGNYPKAIAVYNRATEFESFKRSASTQVRLCNDRSIDYKNMGDYAPAEQDLLAALQIIQTESLGEEREALSAHNLGDLYRIMGAYDKAMPYLKRADELYQAMQNSFLNATVLKIIGDIFLDQDDQAKAMEYYEAAFKKLKDQGQHPDGGRARRRYSETLLRIGDVSRNSNELTKAQESYNEALSIFREQEFSEGIADALTRLGTLFRDMGDFDASLSRFRQAIELSGRIQSPIHQASAFYGMGLTHEGQGDMRAAEQAYYRAIEIVEQDRSNIHGEERITYFAIRQDFYDQLILLLNREGKDKLAFTYSERARARAFLDILDEATDRPGNGMSNGTTPETWQTIQNSLDSNIQIVQYKVTAQELIIFVVDRDSLITETHPTSRQTLNNMVTDYRKTIGADGDNARFSKELATNAKAVYDSSISRARSLSRILVDPIKKYLDEDKIIYISTDEMLNYVPFAALVVEKAGRNQFLVESYNLAYTPSSSILKYLLDHRKPPLAPESLRLFALGNPTGNLQHAAAEVRIIAGMFAFVDTLIGKQVDERTLIRHLDQQTHVFHLATHAVINEQNSIYSYLAVGNDTIPGTANSTNGSAITYDGKLHAREVSTLRLTDARLVTLSACESQKGRLYRGEGVLGFSRAFVKAGASSMLTSVWKVNDQYTKELVVNFYRTLTGSYTELPTALRQAQLKLISEMKEDPVLIYPHPYAWAGFNIVGDYQL